jgi:glycerol-3-phosphate acyltransferase PlsX
LLSTGEEDYKGNILVREATPMFKQSRLNFIGNIEAKDIPQGLADVVVTDGFTGNVYIKGVQGAASAIQKALAREIKQRPLAILGAFLAQGAIKALRTKVDYREFGGGPLLGVNGIVVIAHGRSDAYAIRNAVRVARKAAENNIVQAIEHGLSTWEQSEESNRVKV